MCLYVKPCGCGCVCMCAVLTDWSRRRPPPSPLSHAQVTAYYHSAAAAAAAHETAWAAMFASYAAAHPSLAAELKRRFAGELPSGWMAALPRWKPTDKADATRFVRWGRERPGMAPPSPPCCFAATSLASFSARLSVRSPR